MKSKATNIVILGGGESGVGAAILAKKQGFDVFVSDYGTIKDQYKTTLEKYNIEYEEKQHSKDRILAADEIIKSPGISDKVTLIKQIKKADIPVIDEIEFGSRYTNATIIAITGSNGKTTTTSLTYHLLKTGGYHVGIGGNIGFSFAKQVAEQGFEYYVLELSSFQLDYIKDFKPDIAVLLNITPDHLDRYDYKIQNYIASKFRIIKNMTTDDFFIYNANDANILQALNQTMPTRRPIKKHQYKHGDIDVENARFETREMSITGSHNWFNASCATTIAKLVGLSDDTIQKGLNSFENVPHRMEKVATINGITYINDSKATNVDAVYYALMAMTTPVIWIVGGVDKGNDYSSLLNLVATKVKVMVCLGSDNEKLIATFSPLLKTIEETQSAAEAVRVATLYAQAGDTILLSPACASFDLFKNYIQRGDLFKKAVETLKNTTIQ